LQLSKLHVLHEVYERAKRAVQVDEAFRQVIMTGQAMLMYYSARGQELVPAAICTALRPDDYLVTNYRGLHDEVAKGVPLPELCSEYFGRANGTCKGKGGPMHITHPASGLMVTTGIVGSGLPIANGLALASQLKRDGRVTVVTFGDGASNIGAFHEALNLAAVWKLPVVFVCQNNHVAEHTLYAKGTSAPHVADRAASYSIPGITVDGADPDSLLAVATAAVDRARGGEGPTLIEATTYRFFGHYFGDDTPTIAADELAAAIEADPVPALRARLVADGIATEADLAALEEQIEIEVKDAVTQALAAPMAPPEEINRDVYATEVVA
jgi:TPP-dependent pyruvate/acetoin dehydrogenase alpha subunit